MPGTYWQRTVDHVFMVGLDTAEAMFHLHADQKKNVVAWTATAAANATAPWKIAFGHHPYLSNGLHGNAGSYDGRTDPNDRLSGPGVKDLLETTVCGKFDVYVSGHDHDRQWFAPPPGCPGTELIVSGGGSADLYPLTGTNPARFQSASLGFLYVVVMESTLAGEFVDASGKIDFVRTLTKK
jgi:hypothetical protein